MAPDLLSMTSSQRRARSPGWQVQLRLRRAPRTWQLMAIPSEPLSQSFVQPDVAVSRPPFGGADLAPSAVSQSRMRNDLDSQWIGGLTRRCAFSPYTQPLTLIEEQMTAERFGRLAKLVAALRKRAVSDGCGLVELVQRVGRLQVLLHPTLDDRRGLLDLGQLTD